jgi:hypothetical protein
MNTGPVLAVLLSLSFTTLHSAQEIGSIQQRLSAGMAIPVGELEAIGRLGGCTATLITNTLVLTAAHCVCPNQLRVSPSDCVPRATFFLDNVFPVNNQSARATLSIEGTVRVHPEYTLRGWLREDYAVVNLDRPITAVAKVTPIPLEAPFNTVIPGEAVTLVGYGGMGPDCSAGSKEKLKMSMSVDASGWGGIALKSAAQHVCPGDSGGPALNSSGHVVGVASWGDNVGSTYRPTSYAYNWILGLPQTHWSSCAWFPIGQVGKNSHQPTQLCPDGAFLTALDFDGDRRVSGHDAPVIGQARCCFVAGAESAKWTLSSWVPVGIKSHSGLDTWCPVGHFITGIDLDACGTCDPKDSPIVGQVLCSKLGGSSYAVWGSTYWMDVGTAKSHQPGEWCLDGAFITQIDLDRDGSLDPNDSPIVGHAKCSSLTAASTGGMEFDIDRPGLDYSNFELGQSDPAKCQSACAADSKCKAWTYVKAGNQGAKPRCWLKDSYPAARTNPCCISGVK